MAMTLESLHGRVSDTDSHEMMPVEWFPQYFGEIGQRMVDENQGVWDNIRRFSGRDPQESILAKGLKDDGEITEQAVWEKRLCTAPGLADMDRRVQVLDKMGIHKALIFPGFAIFGMIQATGGGQAGYPVATPEQMALGRLAVKAHNEWAAKQTRRHPDRLSIVGVISSGDPDLTPKSLAKRAEDLIDQGLNAIQISAGEPPAGVSPANLKLDPFYEAFAKSNTTLLFHPPSWMGYRKTEVWDQETPAPTFLTGVYQPMENFLAVMVLGGVFDRHPELRVGFIETTSSWVGPLCERLEHGALTLSNNSHLKLKPREYLQRNVRVSALLDEPIEFWLERYPYLEDVYCWSSDYPHAEGRPWSLREAFKRVAPLGDTIAEKYFVKNSQILFQQS